MTTTTMKHPSHRQEWYILLAFALLMLALAMFGHQAHSQTPSDSVTIASFKMKNPCVKDTVVSINNVDTVWTIINTPCPVAPVVEYRTLYLNKFDAILGTTEETVLKKYLKDYGYNAVSIYDLASIFGSSTKETKLKAFNKDLRLNYGILRIEAVRGDLAGAQGRLKTFNASCTSSLEKFDGVNLEFEFWNQTDIGEAFVTDSTYMSGLSDLGKQMSLAWVRQYIGWYKAPVQSRAPVMLCKYSTSLILHYYRVNADSGYGKSRIDSLNAVNKRNGTTGLVTILISAEPAFGQTDLKTKTLKQYEDYYRSFVNRYSNLKFMGIQVFAYTYMKVSQPPKLQAMARMATPAVGADGEQLVPFKYKHVNKTKKSHLKDAKEPTDQ